jgi:hypothetical protein
VAKLVVSLHRDLQDRFARHEVWFAAMFIFHHGPLYSTVGYDMLLSKAHKKKSP